MSAGLFDVAVLATALAIDLAFGDPPNRWHPVAWLGALIASGRRRLARGSRARLLVSGTLLTIGVALLAGLVGLLITRVAAGLAMGDAALGVAGVARGATGVVLEAVALWCCLSLRGLARAAAEVAAHLDADRVEAARAALGWHLVSRPTADLAEGEVAAAAVESVAENLTDSIVAPALMYVVFGLPGAAVYRAVNTADAMIGYREGALEYFGKLAARADDVLNLIPARVAALAIVAAAPFVRASPVGGLAILRRDRGKTSSPNAGWTMSAMAGALRVRLAKRGAYALGDGPLPTAHDIRRSVTVMTVAAAFVLTLLAIATLATR